jgi:hypothetical protein
MSERKKISDLIQEAYMDPDLVGGSSVRKTEGGRKYATRRKSPSDIKRVKHVGGGKTEPVVQKTRKDVGQERTSKQTQQPTQERGSAALSAKEAQRKAYRERMAREAGKGSTKSADELLKKKSPEKKPVSPSYKPAKPTGYSRKEAMSIRAQGAAKLRGIMRDQEKKKTPNASRGEISRRVEKRMKD